MNNVKKISDQQLADAVAKSTSVQGTLRYLGLSLEGGSHSYYSRRIKVLALDISHHVRSYKQRSKPSEIKLSAAEILVKRDSGGRQKSKLLKRALLEIGREYVCEKCCQVPEWLGSPLTLDIDHINRDWLDDRCENLRFLCPNCHSQFTRGLLVVRAKKVAYTPRPMRHDIRQRAVTLDDDELKALVWSKPIREAAKNFDISDVALKKECKCRGIETPPVGYWLKRENRK